jgi:hypothetical protein
MEEFRESHDFAEGRTLHAAFKLADARGMIAAFEGEGLLRHLPVLTELAEDGSEELFCGRLRGTLSAGPLHAKSDIDTMQTIVPQIIQC